MNIPKNPFLMLLCLLIPLPATAQPSAFHDSRDKVAVSVQFDASEVAQGSDVIAAVIFEHQPHWHTHTNDPQVPPELGSPEDYIATALHFEVPEGSPITVHDGFIQWPKPIIVKVGFGGTPVDYGVFEKTTIIYVPITIASDAPLGKATMVVRPVFQSCEETTCLAPTPMPSSSAEWKEYGIPVSLHIVEPNQIALSAPDSSIFGGFDSSVFSDIHAGVTPPDNSDIAFSAFGVSFHLNTSGSFGLLLLLLVAMGGGFLLNLTPCVLPVIPIKIMGLSASAGNRRKTLILGVWMMLGVMALWVCLGIAIALISGFTAINQLFQYPAFTIILGLFIGIMAVGMGGLFSIRLPNVVYKVNPKHDSIHGSFLFGVMTAVLSTPCTAPFMGAAAAWAATQSPVVTLSVFGSIGFGMAVPYLVLAAFPHLVEKMPRAGAASELIKQVMGLLMLAAAAYFLGVGLSGMFQQEGAPPTRIYLWAVAGCTAAAGIWLAWKTMRISKHTMPRIAFGLIGLLITVLSVSAGVRLTKSGPIAWQYYSAEILDSHLQDGDVAVLEFTAEWCLNCKLLENTVLHSEQVVEAFAQDGVAPIKVDLTGNNAAGNALLDKVGGLRIPLLIILDPDGKEMFRGDFYTVDQVLDAINRGKGS